VLSGVARERAISLSRNTRLYRAAYVVGDECEISIRARVSGPRAVRGQGDMAAAGSRKPARPTFHLVAASRTGHDDGTDGNRQVSERHGTGRALSPSLDDSGHMPEGPQCDAASASLTTRRTTHPHAHLAIVPYFSSLLRWLSPTWCLPQKGYVARPG